MTALATLLTCSLLAGPTPAPAGRNDTGQSRCYDGEELVPCSRETMGDYAPFPRQDGRFGRDARKLGFDLVALDAAGAPAAAGAKPACVHDRTTGLVWQARPGKAAPWDRLPPLIAQLDRARPCGRAGWRLPTRTELVSIVSYGRRTPALDPAFFPAVAPTPTWTADAAAGEPRDRAWTVLLSDGSSAPVPRTTELQWLAVSGAAAAAGARFEPLADGTVRDGLTGLFWDRCAWGQSGAGCEAGGPTRHPWAAALQVAVQANRARHKGHDDWRLPSVKELEALVDVHRVAPAVDPAAFPHIPAYWFWSATPRNGDDAFEEPVKVWDVGLDDAHIGFGLEELAGHVLLVRNAEGYDALGGAAK